MIFNDLNSKSKAQRIVNNLKISLHFFLSCAIKFDILFYGYFFKFERDSLVQSQNIEKIQIHSKTFFTFNFYALGT